MPRDGGSFTLIEHEALHAPAVAALSHSAFRAWLYAIEAGLKANRATRIADAARSFALYPGSVAGAMRKKTFYAVLAELETAGLIVVDRDARPGHPNRITLVCPGGTSATRTRGTSATRTRGTSAPLSSTSIQDPIPPAPSPIHNLSSEHET